VSSPGSSFWQFVDRSGGPNACWPWMRGPYSNGYGIWGHTGAHRVALRLCGMELPPGALACHRCANKRCCNPGHLYAGDNRSNALDYYARTTLEQRRKHGGGRRQAALEHEGHGFDSSTSVACHLPAAALPRACSVCFGFGCFDCGGSDPDVDALRGGTGQQWDDLPIKRRTQPAVEGTRCARA